MEPMPLLLEFLFGFLISLKYKNKFVLGLVDQPILNERYWSSLNNSYLNGKKNFIF